VEVIILFFVFDVVSKLLDDEDNLMKDITETNDESMYETATMTCDYNNMVKNRK
jgi:hypothetical protein